MPPGIGPPVGDWFWLPPNMLPILLNKLLGGHISIETFSIMDIVLSFTTKWDKAIDDFSYESIKHKVVKYTPFLPVDKAAYKEIMRKVFTS